MPPSARRAEPAEGRGEVDGCGAACISLVCSANSACGSIRAFLMAEIFVSHIEEDADLALRIALELEQAGLSTWCYEIDSLPGPSYLIQTGRAIEASKAVVLVISRAALLSTQVAKEVVRAHESAKPIVPILRNLSHADFQRQQPEWREAVGAAASIRVTNADAIAPRLIAGLQMLGISSARPATAERIATLQAALQLSPAPNPSLGPAAPQEHSSHSANTTSASPGAEAPIASAFITFVVRDDESGDRTFRFDAKDDRRIILGRGEQCDVRFFTRSLSRKHTMIWFSDEGHWEVLDLDTANGTYLNGSRINSARLSVGDELCLSLVATLTVTELKSIRQGAR